MSQTLNKTLIVRLSLVVICVNIFISLIFYGFSVRLAENEFQSAITRETAGLADSFTQQLWLFDLNAVDQLAKMALENPDIRRLRLIDQNNKVLLDKGASDKTETTRMREQLVHQSGISIGTLEVFYRDSSRENLIELISKTTVLTILTTIIVTIALIRLLLRRHLLKPLISLQKDMSQVATGEFKKSQLIGQKQEIQSIVDVFNQMAAALEVREIQQTKLEAEIRQKHKMEAIGTMAGGVAHDFNNLLSIITGNLELVKRKLRSGKDPGKNIENIENSTNRAIDMVKQLLAFSRSTEFKLENLDLHKLVSDTLELLRSTIPKTVEINLDIEGAPLHIKGDKTQLQQIIINLCTNAVHAMDEKGLISVSLSATSGPEAPLNTEEKSTDAWAIMSIKDTGCGMDQETVSRIFDPFFTTKGVGKGTGMGLATAIGVIQRLGGDISVDSSPGKGSEFCVYLPITSAKEDQETMEENVVLPTGTEGILLVDDEYAIVEAEIELLTDLGYKVTGIADSETALHVFSQQPGDYDLIVTDQTMPRLSGLELAVRAFEVKPNIPIILCSGFSASVTEHQAKELGIRAYLNKPVSALSLATTIRNVLDSNP